MPDKKPKIVVIADQSARLDPDGEFFRFLRDHHTILTQFEIHCTQQTAETFLGTGLYDKNDIVSHRSHLRGDELVLAAVVELIAMVARHDCIAAIFFSNPSISRVDMIEYRALKRVCIESQVRWLSSLQSAENWAVFEAPLLRESTQSQDTAPPHDQGNLPRNVVDGEHKYLRIPERTIALIAHDKKKIEMLDYVKEKMPLLSRFNRILATGTTGWLLKLRYVGDKQLKQFVDQAAVELGRGDHKAGSNRLVKVLREILPGKQPNLHALLKSLRSNISAEEEFATKVMPLASGPKGGDVLVAQEVLNHTCHVIIFFHDPDEAHPHEADIELLERVCRLGGVYAVCVSDPVSARTWAKGAEAELAADREPTTDASQMRHRFRPKGLHEVILVDTPTHNDSPELGEILAHAAAGYLHQRLAYLMARKREIRVGVAFGYIMDRMVRHLSMVQEACPLRDVARIAETVTFSPLIGIVRAIRHEEEAEEIALCLSSLYKKSGGVFKGLPASGFVLGEGDYSSRPELHEVVEALKAADIIISSAAPWNKNASLLKAGLLTKHCPSLTAGVSTIAGVFVDRNGASAPCDYRVVGLTYDGLKEAASKGSVVLVCGGRERENTVRAALNGELVSVLITNKQTAKAVLQ